MAKSHSGKSGSSMSDKQLARTVIDGRMLTFRLSDGSQIDGYLCGMDDFHWLVVTETASKFLIHKGRVLYVLLYDFSAFSEESNFDALEKIVKPFRERVKRDFFGQVQTEVGSEEF